MNWRKHGDRLIRRIDIDKEVKLAYMDYAMSVIVARALPDSRDGLKLYIDEYYMQCGTWV